ncbi:hypothetical protein IYX23_03915 [Methylocystis sp. L43]|uniref:hypothetical protein n=1 Tax=Methylocystis sp. L43 TaxID=2785790 RepID=UPI0018C20286|nr:hypothetical protein [Methylocystis sp. L43]MBG0796842.1 hypothetical protein [Methylocystis sp. L43]
MTANNEQDAAKEAAAKEAAAKEAAAKKAAAKKAAEEAAANKKQTFVATFRLLLDGSYAAPGATVTLTRAQFHELKALGAIEGDWD